MRIHAIFGGIGAFAVKFRWVVIAAWLIAGFAVPKFLPSLSSVTQGNNSAFLPANAPSEQAAQLAAPFGSTNLIPVPVVAAASQGTLTAADVTWLTGLQHDLGSVKTVVAVRDLGRSADQQAEQLQVLSNVGGGDETGVTNLVNGLRAQIAKAGPPAGLQVHLAGQLAISVDQQTKSGSTGNQVEGLSVIFILVLLLLIFRSLLAPLITLVPAFLAVAISLGVLMDTFIVRTVLVPCTVILLGRWNWWPSGSAGSGRSQAARRSGRSGQHRWPWRPGRGRHRAGHRIRRAAGTLASGSASPAHAGSMIVASSGRIAPHSGHDHGDIPGRLGVVGVLVGLGVDGGGQVAQGGCGVAQGGLVAVRQLGQGHPDDVLVHPVPAGHRLRSRLGQVQADGAAIAVAVGAGRAHHVPRRLQPAEQGGH